MIVILRKIFSRVSNIKTNRISKTPKAEFTRIRHEFEDHLQAINENTNEISSNYEYICEIGNKLEKLSERVEQMQLFLEANNSYAFERKNEFDVKRLNRREQDVFLVIYTLEEEQGSITYSDIAQRLHISEQLAGNYVTSLIEKGVPILKRYVNSRPYLRIEPEFKTLQTKENILQLSLAEFGF